MGGQIESLEPSIAFPCPCRRVGIRDPFATCDADLLGRAVRATLYGESYRKACTVLRDTMLAAGAADQNSPIAETSRDLITPYRRCKPGYLGGSWTATAFGQISEEQAIEEGRALEGIGTCRLLTDDGQAGTDHEAALVIYRDIGVPAARSADRVAAANRGR
jgi:hypothetical protein